MAGGGIIIPARHKGNVAAESISPEHATKIEYLKRKNAWTHRGDVFPFLFFIYPALLAAWVQIIIQYDLWAAGGVEPAESAFNLTASAVKDVPDRLTDVAGSLDVTDGRGGYVTIWIPVLTVISGLSILANILLFLLSHWRVTCRKRLLFDQVGTARQADHVCITPTKPERQTAICRLRKVRTEIPTFLKERFAVSGHQAQQRDVEIYEFEYMKKVYRSDEENIFSSLLFPISEPLDYYLKKSGLTQPEVKAETSYYGANVFDINLPTFVELFKQHAVAPFFVFQIFSVLLWLLDEYWMHSLWTLGMLILIEVQMIFKRLKDMKDLKTMRLKPETLRVFRDSSWTKISSEKLLPGDVFVMPKEVDFVVPCDAVLLYGSAVVNEASLTGESVPQTKVPLVAAEEERKAGTLALRGAHRQHCLFAGTVVMSMHASTAPSPFRIDDVNCCVARCIRTGFATTQGKIVRKLLHSTDRVTGESKEAFLFLFLLLIFSLLSSGYVLKTSWADAAAGRRSRYKLLLNCIMIVTSVVPPEFPITMSMAVTLSMVELVRNKVFCTEPFRLPDAGRATICMFDKTGTLTSEHMQVHGVVGIDGAAEVEKRLLAAPLANVGTEIKMTTKASKKKSDVVTRDAQEPKKTAKIGEQTQPSSGNLVEGGPRPQKKRRVITQESLLETYQTEHAVQVLPFQSAAVLAACHSISKTEDDELVGDSMEKAALTATGFRLKSMDDVVSVTTSDALRILRRFPFNSELQRMSVVARHTGTGKARGLHGSIVTENTAGYGQATTSEDFKGNEKLYVFVKGSVERLRDMLQEVPNGYDAIPEQFQFAGYRVLALAYRSLDKSEVTNFDTMDRASLECNLKHAGFVVVGCPLKPRTVESLNSLKNSAHKLIMCTGDNALTSCQVGASSGLLHTTETNPSEAVARCYLLDSCPKIMSSTENEPEAEMLTWVSAKNSSIKVTVPIADVKTLRTLAQAGALCVTGPIFQAWESHDRFWTYVAPFISVFARMAPQDKENLVHNLTQRGSTIVMCGDGTNDVGALKAAHVGISLLSSPVPVPEKVQLPPLSKTATFADHMARLKAEAAAMDSIQLGTASIASPFTYKGDTITCVPLIIGLGRATLATVITMYKSMAISSIITAFALSVLTLDGVKLGDLQTTVEGTLVSLLVLASSRAAPASKLSPKRPVEKLFHPAVLTSILLQSAIHVLVLYTGWRVASQYRPLDFDPDVDGEFSKNLTNTVIFYLLAGTHGSTFWANYEGAPFMAPLKENAALRKGLKFFFAGVAMLALEAIPQFNEYLSLVPYPNPAMKLLILGLLTFDILGTWVVGSLCCKWSVYAGTKASQEKDIARSDLTFVR